MSHQSPFLQFRELSEQCLAELRRRELRPQEIWLGEDPQGLEEVKLALLRLVEDLAAGMHRLAELEDERFAGVTDLDEWKAMESEAADWREELRKLRPKADPGHVKESLISVRGRISELIDSLAVRAAVRDPANDAASNTLAAKTIAGLIAERDQRELGFGLLEDGVADPWNTALEALDASVVEWSVRLGPEHRVQLEQLCQKLLEQCETIARLSNRSAAVVRLSEATGKNAPALSTIYDRLLKVPAGKMDAGVASDFHYMASLAKRIFEAVRANHGLVISDYAGRSLPAPTAELFQLLHLPLPRARMVTKQPTQTFSRQELEAELGRRLWDRKETDSE